ncbi:MAG: histone deacetylase family protein [Desulfurococcaceae archaeon]
MKVLIVRESTYMHKPGFEHPENPNRVVRIRRALTSFGVEFSDVSGEQVDFKEGFRIACRVHAKDYVERLITLSRSASATIDEDTYITKDSLKLALATLYLAYRYASDEDAVFMISRPPGHHAGKRGKALGAPTQGFCLMNNAVAAVEGFKDRGFSKIAVLDFDAHHGNGTMELLYKERILQVDFHQDPSTLYPHTGYPEELGEGEGYGFKLNIVLPPAGGDDLFMSILPMVSDLFEKYSPDALVVSAGFDAFEDDGLADLRLTETSFYSLGRLIRRLKAPTLIVLEGGYGAGLQRGIVAFVHGLRGIEQTYEHHTSTPPSLYRKALEIATKTLERFSGAST